MESHNFLKKYFNDLADLFSSHFGQAEDLKLPFQRDEHQWLNYFYKSKATRHIHLEYYKTEKMCVLHCNIFPDPNVDIPILGVDAIALGDKITGIFFDITPVGDNDLAPISNALQKLNSKITSTKRELPEWANFFSNNFLCVTPKQEELDFIFNNIFILVKNYLHAILVQVGKYNKNTSNQNLYCKGQKKNDKTYKSLAFEIGEDNASLFLNKFLFPEVDN